jgi:hypothetical protein
MKILSQGKMRPIVCAILVLMVGVCAADGAVNRRKVILYCKKENCAVRSPLP